MFFNILKIRFTHHKIIILLYYVKMDVKADYCVNVQVENLNLVQGACVCVSLFRDLGNVVGVNMRNISYYTPTSSRELMDIYRVEITDEKFHYPNIYKFFYL